MNSVDWNTVVKSFLTFGASQQLQSLLLMIMETGAVIMLHIAMYSKAGRVFVGWKVENVSWAESAVQY